MLTNARFPVTLKNTTKSKRVVGSMWFAPNEQLVISEQVYKRSKSQIDYSLDMGYIAIATRERKVDRKENAIVPEVQEEVMVIEEDLEEDSKSIVDQFAEKKVHWTAVRKYVDNLDSLDELESLLIDAQFHGLTEDSVIVKSINDRIGILEEKNQ